jgi:protein-S-isoprenylcysteine O-methyltransferase Ste14
MNETIFRSAAAIIIISAFGISVFFRRKADKDSGGVIPRKVDGLIMMTIIKAGGIILWLSPLVYLINPEWMSWSKIGMKDWVRLTGIGLGILSLGLIYWIFISIGNNISPTSATRIDHKLITTGPYKWVRHPLYTIGSLVFLSFGLTADNWFIILLSVMAFVVMAFRIPREEQNLNEKFGADYKKYMKRTGRFLPRFRK